MDISRLKNLAGLDEAAPSAGLTSKEKTEIVKKAKKGEDIGEPGKTFSKIAKAAAERYGSEEAGRRVAAAVMWKKLAKEDVEYTTEEIETILKQYEDDNKSHSSLNEVLSIAGIDLEPVIEFVEEDADTFIVFESKNSPKVVGVFRSAQDAKNVLKKYKKAVGKAYKAK